MQDESRAKPEFEAALTDDAWRSAWRYAWYLCAEYDDAQDLLQDALAQAFRCFGQLSDPHRFCGWLLSIVRSQYLMHRRRPQLRRHCNDAAIDLHAHGCSRPGGDPAGGLANLPPELAAALLRLPSGQREVVELYYLHELDLAEVARVLGISPSNAKVRLFRGRSALRRGLVRTSAAECHAGEKP